MWMVLNVCTVKMIEINKIKELPLGPNFKKKYVWVGGTGEITPFAEQSKEKGAGQWSQQVP